MLSGFKVPYLSLRDCKKKKKLKRVDWGRDHLAQMLIS